MNLDTGPEGAAAAPGHCGDSRRNDYANPRSPLPLSRHAPVGSAGRFFRGKAQAPCLLEMQYVPIHLKSSNLRFD